MRSTMTQCVEKRGLASMRHRWHLLCRLVTVGAFLDAPLSSSVLIKNHCGLFPGHRSCRAPVPGQHVCCVFVGRGGIMFLGRTSSSSGRVLNNAQCLCCRLVGQNASQHSTVVARLLRTSVPKARPSASQRHLLLHLHQINDTKSKTAFQEQKKGEMRNQKPKKKTSEMRTLRPSPSPAFLV